MDESILTSVKALLGITEEETYFDDQIVMHINSVLGVLCQLGVGPSVGFAISDESQTWGDFLGDESTVNLSNLVKPYVGAKVRMQFDPPQSGIHAEAINKMIAEYEWRLNIQADVPTEHVGE